MLMPVHQVHHARLQLHADAPRALLLQALPLALEQALDSAAPAGALWLLRHLPCELSLDADADLTGTVAALTRSLRVALHEVQPERQAADWVRIDEPLTALVEAFSDAMTGRRDRAWAWQQLGMWSATSTSAQGGSARLAELMPALDRRPLLQAMAHNDPAPEQRRRALLAALLSRGLLPRALSLLQAPQWALLAQGLPGGLAVQALLALEPAPQADPRAFAAYSSAAASPHWPAGAEAAACLAALHSAPLSAARCAAAAPWLAWLACLHSDPTGLHGLPAAAAVARLQALASTALGQVPRGASTRSPSQGAATPSRTPQSGAAAAAPAVWRSAHAGLLHLLLLLPGSLPAAAGELSRERLLRLAVQGLDVPLSDPVLAPWLGLLAPAPLEAPSLSPQTAIDRIALEHAVQALLQRYLPAAQRETIAADPLPWLLQRSAALRCTAGRWVVHHDEADTRLRRCGLDRDPGHLPWLGLTVVMHYE